MRLASDLEDVGTFNRGTALDIRLRITIGKGRTVETCDETQFSHGGFGSGAVVTKSARAWTKRTQNLSTHYVAM